jgi:hypothetical protein
VAQKYGQSPSKECSYKVCIPPHHVRVCRLILTRLTGLREYWQSPWATFSRGRSRWRNQFLVDYLQKQGITRTKKQVASHIQVLRNMWKGEPGVYMRLIP